MYRLLVVDNERVVVDSMMAYFEGLKDARLEALGAYSAHEALRVMQSTRIDILLSDIRMPAMDGLQLQKEVLRRWPWCRTIFLTGYSDFDYIHQAMRAGGAGYILKSEGKQAILDAVGRVIAQLEAQTEERDLIARAERLFAHALPLLQSQVLHQLLDGKGAPPGGLTAAFAQYEIGLDPQKVYPVLLRFDDADEARAAGLETVQLTVETLGHEYFKVAAALKQVMLGEDAMVWLLSYHSDWDERHRRVFAQGAVELLQAQLESRLGVHLSACLAYREVAWDDLARQVERMRYLLNRSMGGRKNVNFYLTEEEGRGAPAGLGGGERKALEKLKTMDVYLEGGNRGAFFAGCAEVIRAADGAAERARGGVRLEVAHAVLAMLLSQINRWGLGEDLSCAARACAPEAAADQSGWQDLVERLRRLAGAVFDAKARCLDRQDDDLIRRVHWTIENNLGGDLSMTMLGEIEGLNPYYLARLYKGLTGEPLKSYIAGRRLLKAKALLCEGRLLNREIASAIGFNTEQSFIRFFKANLGLTPNEYRESARAGAEP